MKTLSILVTLLFATIEGYGQNLVPNPSFEEYDTCPDNLGQVYHVSGWTSTRLSPDYFNTCSNGGFNNPSVPNNYWGYQVPASGTAYCGFAARYGDSDIREFLGASLNHPLQSGTEYYVSFRVSLFFKDTNSLTCAVNNLGVLLTMNSYSESNPVPICNRSQVYTSSIITDTSAWITINGSFIADSNYTFINIGNFFSDSLTDSIQIHGQTCDAYYYIDDVCVSTDSSTCNLSTEITSTVEDNTKIYPNPANDLLKIYLSKACDAVRLYDNLGKLAFEKFNVSDELEIDVSAFQPGVYIIETVRRDYLNTKKIIILK